MSNKTSITAALLSLVGSVLGCSSREPSDYFDLVASFARASVEASDDGAPRADAGEELLFLPAGSSLTYCFEGHRESTLSIARLAMRGEGARLVVTLASDTGGSLLERALDRPGQQLAVELPFDATLGRPPALGLTLKAQSDSMASGDGVLLVAPVIRGSKPPTAAVTPVSFERPVASEGVRRPDVVVYLIDTLRRDRLGTYGYDRPVSPNIDEFARVATVFERAVAQSSWTKPSLASVMTGVWPPAHGAIAGHHGLPASTVTLAERLRAAGYQTAGFVTNPNAGGAFGFDQGFDHFWKEKKYRSDLLNEKVLEWLDGPRPQGPVLLYVHTMDPHAGYNPGEPFRSRFAPTADQMKKWKPRWRWPVANLPFFRDLYDGEIAQNDAAFGALMEALRARGLFESSLIFVLSDHGEEFQEHNNWRHGRRLYNETLDVPMIVKFPGQREGGRSDTTVSHVDVLPTVLDVAGLPREEALEGESLVEPVERPVFSHVDPGRAPLQYSVVDRGWKLIQMHGKRPRTQLFDVVEDPLETHDLSAERPVRRALLEGLLRERLARMEKGETEEVEVSDELRKELRALGYLH